MIYLLDANVFIEAHKRYYRFAVVPGFWSWLESQSGTLASITSVYDELVDLRDELSGWTRRFAGNDANFFQRIDDEATQRHYADVATWAARHPRFSAPAKAEFLSVADSWLVAKARSLGATVVTHEVPAPNAIKSVKVPDACDALAVRWMNGFDMLSRLGACFVLGNPIRQPSSDPPLPPTIEGPPDDPLPPAIEASPDDDAGPSFGEGPDEIAEPADELYQAEYIEFLDGPKAAIRKAISLLVWDFEAGRVSVDGSPDAQYFETLGALVEHLDHVGFEVYNASAPRDSGDWVFEYDVDPSSYLDELCSSEIEQMGW